MLEHESVPGVVESLKVVTEPHLERLCRYTFQLARENNRKKVTLVHKANIMKLTDGLFMEVFARVGAEFPDIRHDQGWRQPLLHCRKSQFLLESKKNF